MGARKVSAWVGWLFAVLIALANTSTARAEDALHGIALVIGQSRYEHLPQLPNPANDARAIDRLLSDLGFEVDTVFDGDLKRLQRSLDRFVEDAADADVALVYYSGHGIEAGGENFLLPTDAAPTATMKADDLVPVSSFLGRLQAVAPVTIVLLDACRSNPLPPGTLLQAADAAPVAVNTVGLAAQRGAAPISDGSDGALGTVIGFAAEPGHAALDGEAGGNSPYAAALLKHLAAGGFDFGDVMTMVTEEVYLATKARQIPWTNASLRRLLYFGVAPEAKGGDDVLIRDERRKLLLTIAATPQDRRAMVEDVATLNGVPLDALYGMLKVLEVDTTAGAADLQGQLSRGAERLKTILAERDVQVREDPEIIRLASLADRAEQQGAIALALAFRSRASDRAEIIDKAIDDAEANVKARRLELAATFASHADTAVLNFDYALAGEKYLEAFAQAERWNSETAFTYKLSAADAFSDLGNSRGDRAALDRSVAVYREALTMPSAQEPRRAARVLTNMAITLTFIGEQEPGTEHLEQAATAYADILKVLTKDASPADWAVVQLNLGNVYHSLADRTGGPEDLQRAKKAFLAALTVITRDSDAVAWAGIQVNLGNIFYSEGENGGGAESFRQSVAYLRAAGEVWTRENNPRDWAMLQVNLGSSLTALGAREQDQATLEQAVAAYQAALQIYARDRFPGNWADTQNNLASALLELAVLDGKSATYEASLAALRLSLEERSRDQNPLAWAMGKYNEGRTLLFLGRHEQSIPRFREAATALTAATEVLDPAQLPIQWARARSVLGETLVEIGVRTKDRRALEAAREAFLSASKAFHDNGMGETGQGFWEKQVATIDAELKKLN